MKKLVFNSLTLVIAVCLTLILTGCSECDQEDPTVRLKNSSTDIIDVQLKTSDGKTEDFDNIWVTVSIGLRAIDPGETEFIIFGESVTDSIVYQFEAEFCTKYELELHPDNSITRRNLVTP